MKLDEQGIRALDAEIGAYASNEAMSGLVAQLDPRYAVRGLVDLGGPLTHEMLDACHEAVSRILVFRAQIAAERNRGLAPPETPGNFNEGSSLGEPDFICTPQFAQTRMGRPRQLLQKIQRRAGKCFQVPFVGVGIVVRVDDHALQIATLHQHERVARAFGIGEHHSA